MPRPMAPLDSVPPPPLTDVCGALPELICVLNQYASLFLFVIFTWLLIVLLLYTRDSRTSVVSNHYFIVGKGCNELPLLPMPTPLPIDASVLYRSRKDP